MNRTLALIVLVTSVFFMDSASAVKEVVSRTASATIRSKNSTIDLRTGTNQFTGNVKVDHVAFDLFADEIIESRVGNETQRLVATGSPVRFKQNQPFSEKISHGHADKIEYDATKKELRMWNYEITDLEGTVMKGETILYLLLEEKES